MFKCEKCDKLRKGDKRKAIWREWKDISPGKGELLGEYRVRYRHLIRFASLTDAFTDSHLRFTANKLTIQPKETLTHVGLAALRSLRAKGVLSSLDFDSPSTSNGDTTMEDALDKEKLKELLTVEAKAFLPSGTELPEEEWGVVCGEM